MNPIIEIQNLSQPELSVFSRLTEAQLRNRLEPKQGILIAESPKVIQTALENGFVPLSFLMERKQIDGPAKEIIARCENVPVYTADRSVLEQLTGYTLTRGVLCAMRRPPLPELEAVCVNAHRIAVLEGIADATNVGAIFRSAAALNIDAVLITPTCCDPFNRRAIRVSMGTVFQIPWTQIGDTPDQWPDPGLKQLQHLGFHTVAMALRKDSTFIDDPRLRSKEKLAIVLGTEGDGLAKETIAACDDTVLIPMAHGVDSLNVAAASAVAFWELRVR